MADKTIYSLLAKASGESFELGESIPARIEIPGCGDVIMGAAEGWESDQYAITSSLVDVPDPPAARRLVQKSVIVDRLISAGKLDAARTALDVASLGTRERWNARLAIYADDPDAIALLQAIGADPAAIMAPE